MQKSHEEAVEDSRDVLLGAIGEPEDLTFIRLYGNIGDDLIYAAPDNCWRDDSTRRSASGI